MRDVESYLASVGARLRLAQAEKDQVLRELRAHIEEKVADLCAQGTPRDVAVQAALADLGAPDELAVAYNGPRTEVKDRRGETILRVGRAVGRGTATALKWVAIAAAFLLVVGAVVAYVAYQEAKPYIEDHYPRLVFDADRDCTGSPCSTLPMTQAFAVPDGSRTLQAEIEVRLPMAAGSMQVVVTDPQGRVVYDRTFAAGAETQEVRDVVTWGPVQGTWEVEMRFAAFAGRFNMDVVAIGLPPGTLN